MGKIRNLEEIKVTPKEIKNAIVALNLKLAKLDEQSRRNSILLTQFSEDIFNIKENNDDIKKYYKNLQEFLTLQKQVDFNRPSTYGTIKATEAKMEELANENRELVKTNPEVKKFHTMLKEKNELGKKQDACLSLQKKIKSQIRENKEMLNKIYEKAHEEKEKSLTKEKTLTKTKF